MCRQLQALLILLALACCSCQTTSGVGPSAPPLWAAGFKARNNVTFDSTSRTATLAGATTYSGSLAPSASLISSNSYDGDITINITLAEWKILQSGYQAQVSVFLAPTNYSALIGDYLSWPGTDAINSQQCAFARAKIYTTAIPDYTWASMVVPSTGLSKSIGVAGAWSQKGVISLSRKADQVSGFLQVGTSQVIPFAGLKVPTGPVVLGVQILYGYYYSVTISNISVTAGQVITPKESEPEPVLTKWRSGSSEASWRSVFNTRIGVSFDNITGAATLAGSAAAAGSLAPSAGLVSRAAFVGDFQINVTVSDYRILQPGYQAHVALFMAPNYTLSDLLSWPETDQSSQQQAAFVRAKIYTTDIPNYTWASMFTAGNGTTSVGTAGAWQQKGVLSLRRKGSVLSGFLQVGASPAVAFPPATAPTTGPVVLGLQMLYGYNYSLTVAQVDIAYESLADLPPNVRRVSGSETTWRSLFETKNGVSFDSGSGDVTLSGSNPPPGTLSPSAALLTRVGFDGDFQMNVTIREYKILQSGYQAYPALFVAPLTYQLGDYLSWPETDALGSQQVAFIRAKIYTTDIPNYTWASMYTAGNGTTSVGTAGAWQKKVGPAMV